MVATVGPAMRRSSTIGAGGAGGRGDARPASGWVAVVDMAVGSRPGGDGRRRFTTEITETRSRAGSGRVDESAALATDRAFLPSLSVVSVFSVVKMPSERTR